MRKLHALGIRGVFWSVLGLCLVINAVAAPSLTPVIHISISPDPALPNQALTLIATFDTVSGQTPTGQVRFYVDNLAYGPGPVSISGGSASISAPGGLPAGTHKVGATYAGDINFFPQSYTTNELTFTFNSIAVTSSPASPIVSGQPVTLTAAITGGSNVTGTVTFYDNGSQIGSPVSVSSNLAQFGPYSGFTHSGSPHSITAVYSGDSLNFGANNSGSPFSLTVNADGTTTSNVSVTGTPTFGHSATFTVTVSANSPGSGTPTGTVSFSDGASPLGSATLTAGSASISVSSLSAGSHTINAAYSGDTNFQASSSATPVSIAQATPTVTVTSSPASPAVFGQPVTFTAALNTGGGAATGTIHFFYGATDLGTVAVGSNQAQVGPVSTPAVGSPTVTANYSGDSNNAAASGTMGFQVNQASASVSVPSVTGTQTFGQTLTFSVSVTAAAPGSGTPSGTVTYRDGATVLGTVTISSGSASYSTSSLGSGSHTISATYNGDTNFASGASNSTDIKIGQFAPTVTVTSSPSSPVVNGQAVVFTATLNGTGTIGGTVDFFDNGTKINPSSISVSSNQAVSNSYAIGGVGTHAITAVYSGDANNGSANNNATPLSLVVNKASSGVSTPAMTGTPNVGANLTFTVTVSPSAPGSGVPTGTVTFKDGATSLTTVGVTNGSASYSTSSLALGSHSISATYSGDAGFVGSSSASLAVTVTRFNSAVLLSYRAGPSSTVLSAAVTASGAPAPPTGTVQFTDGGTNLGTATLSGGSGSTSSASVTVASSLSGTVTATYSGDTDTNGSNASVALGSQNSSATSLVITATPNPPSAGQTVKFTVTIQGGTSSNIPSGTIQFLDGATPLSTVAVSGGQVVYSVVLSIGTHSITVNYSGDSAFPGASASYGITVAKYGPSAALTSSVSPSVWGQSVVLTATVTGHDAGVAAPTGQVQFLEGASVLATAALANGSASVTVNNLAPGSHSITALYGGDANYGSAWANLVQSVLQASTSTAISTSGSGPQVVLTAAVAALAPGAGAPTGTVQFEDATTGQSLASGAVANGLATATAPVASGHVIAAVYSGDTDFLTSSSAPVPQFAILNSASYAPADLAPDEIVTVFSPSLATGASQAQTPLPTTLGGTSVTVVDSSNTARQASMFYASQTQLSFLVPAGVTQGPATVKIQTAAGTLLTAAVNIGSIAPGLYAANAAGGGLAAAQIVRVDAGGSQDTLNTAQWDAGQQAWSSIPVDLSVSGDSVYLILYATGIRHKNSSVTCTINGNTYPVTYAGAQRSFAGLDQVNVGPLPSSLTGAGRADVTITVDGQVSNKVQVTFK